VILVDSSVWIDHLHRAEPDLVNALEVSDVVAHPMVVGELALGSIRRRGEFLELVQRLPLVRAASHDEVLALVAARKLYGRGLGLVDVHLLASTLLTPGTRLWTRDVSLRRACDELGVGGRHG
jgi:predicted nucleic acid-binding protein